MELSKIKLRSVDGIRLTLFLRVNSILTNSSD